MNAYEQRHSVGPEYEISIIIPTTQQFSLFFSDIYSHGDSLFSLNLNVSPEY